MSNSNSLKSSAEQINVLIVIDTDYIKNKYPSNSDPNNPVAIDHASQFMICTDPRNTPSTPISGQATADLNFPAHVGDFVSFSGTSIYGNSDDAVIVYDIVHWKEANVFNGFESNLVTLANAVVPGQGKALPPSSANLTFANYTAQVGNSGTEYFMVKFALYEVDATGETQVPYGYFIWDPSITVS